MLGRGPVNLVKFKQVEVDIDTIVMGHFTT